MCLLKIFFFLLSLFFRPDIFQPRPSFMMTLDNVFLRLGKQSPLTHAHRTVFELETSPNQTHYTGYSSYHHDNGRSSLMEVGDFGSPLQGALVHPDGDGVGERLYSNRRAWRNSLPVNQEAEAKG